MRLPYVADPPPTSTAEEARIVAAVRARRAPRPLQPLDLALLHSPPVADGWNSFLGAIRTRTSLAQDIRELAISRVAVVNRAWYEWGHHAPLAVQGGVAEELMEKIKVPQQLRLDGDDGSREGFSDKQWATLVYADEMTRNVEVSDGTFARLRELFSEREVVEITGTVAAYNCVSRFLVALDGEFSPPHLSSIGWPVRCSRLG
jgi:alkylhydroperoxidase family enzyme